MPLRQDEAWGLEKGDILWRLDSGITPPKPGVFVRRDAAWGKTGSLLVKFPTDGAVSKLYPGILTQDQNEAQEAHYAAVREKIRQIEDECELLLKLLPQTEDPI